LFSLILQWGTLLVAQLVDALRYKPLTEMSTRNIFWVAKAAGA
jgi:hypothetical protein